MGQDKLTWQVDSYAFGICCIEILQKGGVPWPLNDEYSVRRFVLRE
jgi:abelson tyrosine-protein kinase 1